MASTYRSKIDAWLLVVLLVAMAAVLYAGWQHAGVEGRDGWPALLAMLAMGVCLPCWLLLDTRYTLDAEVLRVRSGPFRWTIQLRAISRVEPSRNPLASPALSLDRLRIEYGDGASLLVSPRRKEAFLRELQARIGRA